MKVLYCVAVAGLFMLCACNIEPTDAAKANGMLNTATPGKWQDGDFSDQPTVPTEPDSGRAPAADTDTTETKTAE